MGQKDITEKVLEDYNDVFADIINGLLFDGVQEIKPEAYRQAGYKTEVLPVSTEEYGLSKAARPFNSRLDKSKLAEAGFTPLPTWQDALSRYLKEIEQ